MPCAAGEVKIGPEESPVDRKEIENTNPDDREGYPVFRHTTLLVVLVATILLEPLAGSGLTTAVFLSAMIVVSALLDGSQRRTKMAIGIMGVPALILFAVQFLSSEFHVQHGSCQRLVRKGHQ